MRSARRAGKHVSRPSTLTPEKLDLAHRLIGENKGRAVVAEMLGAPSLNLSRLPNVLQALVQDATATAEWRSSALLRSICPNECRLIRSVWPCRCRPRFTDAAEAHSSVCVALPTPSARGCLSGARTRRWGDDPRPRSHRPCGPARSH